MQRRGTVGVYVRKVVPVAASGPMESCPEETLLADYLDGRLDARPRVDVEEHLAGCATCRRTVAFSCPERDGESEEQAATFVTARPMA